jgi:F0F1-type ATP synthase membrane subunit b/b'
MDDNSKENKLSTVYKRILNSFTGVLFLLCVAICGMGLWQSFDAFLVSQREFGDAYNRAATEIANGVATISADQSVDSKNAVETISILLDHLGQLQTIQKNTSTESIMSFLYSTLATALISACLYYVARAKKYSEKTRNYNKQIKDGIDYALKNKEAVEKYVEETKKIYNRVNEDMSKYLNKVEMDSKGVDERNESITALQNELQRNLEFTKDEIERVKKNASSNRALITIEIDIAYFKRALSMGERIRANALITDICRNVESVPDTVDTNSVKRIYYELRDLYLPIRYFVEDIKFNKEKFESFDDGKVWIENERKARIVAQEVYNVWLKKAVEHCDRILKQKEID